MYLKHFIAAFCLTQIVQYRKDIQASVERVVPGEESSTGRT